jgi:hypothetical protein
MAPHGKGVSISRAQLSSLDLRQAAYSVCRLPVVLLTSIFITGTCFGHKPPLGSWFFFNRGDTPPWIGAAG